MSRHSKYSFPSFFPLLGHFTGLCIISLSLRTPILAVTPELKNASAHLCDPLQKFLQMEPVCACACAQLCSTRCDLIGWSRQAPLAVEFSRQEYWSGLPFRTPGDLPNPGIEPESLASPALAGRFFHTVTWEAHGLSLDLCG